MKRIFALFIFYTLSSSLAFAQIEKPKSAGGTKTPSTTSPSNANVEISWTGAGSSIIHIGTKTISLESGKTGSLIVPPNIATKIQVEKPDQTYSYGEFVIFEKGKSFLEVYMHDGVITVLKETESERKAKSSEEKRIDSLVTIAYKHSLIELRASHILAKCDPNALPQDTAIAFSRVLILQNLLEGKPAKKLINDYEAKLKLKLNITNISSPEDTTKLFNLIKPLYILEAKYKGRPAPFEEVAFLASEDESAKTNRGDLGYFTAFSMVYEFETFAYNTPVGKISGSVRTRFGYHILKVTDRRPSKGQILVAHIMIKAPEGMPTADSIIAKAKADEVYAKVKAGEDFTTLVNQFSDDKVSSINSGQLKWFVVGEMPLPFESTAFSLAKNGDVSPPIKTKWGWHIIKRIDKRESLPFETVKDDLRKKVLSIWLTK